MYLYMPSAWCPTLGTRHSARGTRHAALGTRHAALGTRHATPTYVAPPLNFQSKPTTLPSLSQVVSKTGAAEADLGHGKGPHFDMILANAVIKVG